MARIKKLQWVRMWITRRLHKPHPFRPWLSDKNKPCEPAKAAKFMNEHGDIFPVTYITETIYEQ